MMVRKSGYKRTEQGAISRRVCVAIAATFLCMGVLPVGRGQALPWLRSRQAETTDRPPNTAGQSAGSRGCSLSETPSNPSLAHELGPLTILSPEVAGGTALAHPTFAWFTSVSTDNPVEIRIYRYTDKREGIELFYEAELTESFPSSGIKIFSLPSSVAPLVLEDQYIFQVEIVCDPSHPSGNLFSEIEINRTEIDQNLRLELEESASVDSTIEILNREGLWLDALNVAMQSTTSKEIALEQLAIMTQYTALYELSRHFPVYSYSTTP